MKINRATVRKNRASEENNRDDRLHLRDEAPKSIALGLFNAHSKAGLIRRISSLNSAAKQNTASAFDNLSRLPPPCSLF
jgi:alpha-D-ribose 1-methylphosphonate 5-triphosphate diphosphatase PhnM